MCRQSNLCALTFHKNSNILLIERIESMQKILRCLACNPVIAAVQQDALREAIDSPAEVIFHLGADLMSIPDIVQAVHNANKYIFIHIDLVEGLGRDRTAVKYIAQCGADGIISTKAQLIRYAKEYDLVTVQRFFAVDSKGVESIEEILHSSNPHLMEIMPGVIGKAIRRFSKSHVPVIAGGLIQSKAEVTAALNCGAIAVSTGQADLWYL